MRHGLIGSATNTCSHGLVCRCAHSPWGIYEYTRPNLPATASLATPKCPDVRQTSVPAAERFAAVCPDASYGTRPCTRQLCDMRACPHLRTVPASCLSFVSHRYTHTRWYASMPPATCPDAFIIQHPTQGYTPDGAPPPGSGPAARQGAAHAAAGWCGPGGPG